MTRRGSRPSWAIALSLWPSARLAPNGQSAPQKTLDRLLERLQGRRSKGGINFDRSVQWHSRHCFVAIPAAQKAKYP
jgi:hypothetical protein